MRRPEAVELCAEVGDPGEVVAWAVCLRSPLVDGGFARWRGWVLMALCRTPGRAYRLATSETSYGGDGHEVCVVRVLRRYGSARAGDWLGEGWVADHREALEDLERFAAARP